MLFLSSPHFDLIIVFIIFFFFSYDDLLMGLETFLNADQISNHCRCRGRGFESSNQILNS